MNKLTNHKIDLVAAAAREFSDMTESALRQVAFAFCEAHERVPSGLSIEVGTRLGGSAWLFAELLTAMYSAEYAPPLWTVDPYGSKPYEGGDSNLVPIYRDDVEYVAMKRLLAGYSFHTHWKLEAREFFNAAERLSYWTPGNRAISYNGGELVLPIGEKRAAWPENASFLLLDGEHSAESIEAETRHGLCYVKSKGTIVIDNIDADPKTKPMLQARFSYVFKDLSGSMAVGVKP